MDDKQKPGQLDDILRRRNELDDILEDRFKRPTTIVFTDIVGATNYFSTRGDLEGQLMIQRHNDLLIPLITKHSGNLINIVGDGLLASFEMSSTAVACAVDMQESLLRLNAARAERDQTQVRIGINTGTGYVESGNVYGVVINVAERVKALADGDQILISESTYQSLQPGKDPLCAFLDKVRVKGIEEEIKVYQVVWRNGERGQSLRGGARRDLGANKADLVLEAARENGQIKVCAFERGDGSERTLRPYENVAVSWDQVETTRREIITLLNRANDRAKVTSDILASLKISGRLLFDLLIPSNTRATLETTTVRNLTLYVDDKLVHIPWELLFDGKQFLCRRFAMGRIVSARQAPTSAASRASKAPYKVLILGDPRGDLDGSYREGLEIKDFLDEKRDMFHVDFKSDPVDVAFVKKNLCDYDIVHYAGHAEYNSGNPSENGWLLKDARLKASEISAMGGSQPMPSLVFSNARQSGHSGEWQLGEDCQQQIYGLANAYLLAGVQHYIGTFWEILDEPSGYFAKRFYGFVAQGMPVGEAVRRARLELIDAYGEETIVWATYMLYGDPTFEFSKDRRETVVEPVARQPVCVEAPQAVHSEEIAQPQPAVQKSYTHFVYPLLGLLLLALAYGGHSFFFKTNTKMPERQPEAQQTQVGASAPAAREPIIPAQQEKSPPGSVPVAKVNNRPDVAKPKELTSTAKPQQAAPAPKPDEVAVAKGPAPAPVAAPLTLKMNIIGQRKERDGSYSEILVSEGRVLRSRDNFQIHLEASRSAYVYVLLYDSQGKASQVFPDPKANQEGLLSSGSKLVIPSRDRWFWLDESTGTETIYVLAAENPMSDVRGLLAKMEGGDEAGQKSAWQEIKQRIAVMQRGVGAISKGQAVTYTLSDGKKIQKLTDVVTAKGSVVRIVSFQHK